METTKPTVLAVDQALPLFYAERVNSIFGESGGGKTWVALAAVAEVVKAGGRAAFIDYEDHANGIAERLVQLGLDDDEIDRVDYRNPTTGIGIAFERLSARAEAGTYTLIVIDSTGEAMAASGVDANADREVAQWFAVVKKLTRLPGAPCVIVLDHVPKAADAPAAFAIGSQRKRAAVTGASYRVDTLREPSRGREGRLKLVVAKDRLGNRAKGTTACLVDVKPVAGLIEGGVELCTHLSDSQVAAEKGEKFRPTELMTRISSWLEINPGASRNRLLGDVSGKREYLETALRVLVEEGFVRVESGTRGALTHFVERPFREVLAPFQPVDNSTYAPRPDLGPTSAGPKSDDLGPSALPPKGGRGPGPESAELKTPSTSALVDNSQLEVDPPW